MLLECTDCALFGSKASRNVQVMGVTLREVLALDVLRRAGARVVAGAESLDRPVRWVHIAEIADIATLINGGELLLSTGMGIASDAAAQRRYLTSIADAGACGLIIELGRMFSAIPPAMVQVATARTFPLIALERPARYIEVTEAVHRTIISHQYDLLRQASDISAELTDLILDGAGIEQIVSRLAALLGNPVLVEDAAHNVIASAGRCPEGHVPHAAPEPRDSPEPGQAEQRGQVRAGPGCVWAGIWLRHEEWGRVHVVETARALDEITGLVLDRAGAALGLALLAQKDEAHLLGRAASALLADVLAGRQISAVEFIRRARGLRVDLSGGRLIGLVVHAAPGRPDDSARSEPAVRPESEQQRQVRMLRVSDEIRRCAAERGTAVLTGLHADRVLCVASLPGPVTVLDDIMMAVSRRLTPVIVAAGAGRPVAGGSLSLQRSLEEAAEALEFGSGWTDGGLRHFGDLGVYQLLIRLAADPELSRFVDAELSALLEHDARSHAKLLPTLRCYLDCAGRKADTVRKLRVQRRTLYARLSRISAILGQDLEAADARLRLTLAVRAYDLLNSPSRRAAT